MTLRHRLWANAVIPAAVAALIAIALLFTMRQVDEVRHQSEIADGVSRGIFELNILAQEYALRGGQRVVAQWRARHDSLGRLLEAVQEGRSEEADLIAGLRHEHGGVGDLFEELMEAGVGAWHEHLLSQVLLRARAMDSAARQLATLRDREVVAVQRRVDSFVIGAVVALAVTLAVIQILLSRTVMRCIARLIDGIGAFGRGNLEYRIQPGSVAEFDAIASSFNAMAGRLAESTTSIENLRRETLERERSEKQARDGARKYRTLLESLPQKIFAKDRNSVYLHCNDNFARDLGLRPEDIAGHTDHDFFPGELADKYRADDRRLMESGATEVLEEKYPHAGEERWIRTVKTPLRDAQGAVSGILGVFWDITDSKRAQDRLRASEARYRSYIEVTGQLGWTTSGAGEVTEDIPTWRRYTGQSAAEVMGWGWIEALHPDDRERTSAIWRKAQEAKSLYEAEYRIRRHDGEYRQFLARGVPELGADGEIREWVGTCIDITDRKRDEEELRRYRERLEDIVRTRTAQLETANKDLEGFSYSVSHDLRTPLRAIDGFSRIVLEEYSGKLDDEGKRLLNVVRDNTMKMSRLIDDILQFSRAGRLELAPVEVDVESLVRSVWEDLAPFIGARTLRLECKSLPRACADHGALTQVLANLLANAVKFTRPRDSAVIEVGAEQGDGETVYYVRDNGVGFDMQYAHKLFGVFQRLHGPDEFEGTGIGLAIVKRVVTKHGGRVWAEGNLNEGATIFFALPRREPCEGGKR